MITRTAVPVQGLVTKHQDAATCAYVSVPPGTKTVISTILANDERKWYR